MLHGQPLGLIFTLQIPQNATWTAYIPTFTLQIPAMLHGQPTFQHLLCRFPPCYMDSLHLNIYSVDSLHATWTTFSFNIYSADSLNATWTAYISTFTLQISAMLN